MMQVLIIHHTALLSPRLASLWVALISLLLPLAMTHAETQAPPVMSPYTW